MTGNKESALFERILCTIYIPPLHSPSKYGTMLLRELSRILEVVFVKRKREWKGFALGMITATLLFCLGTTALAARVQQLNANYNDIKIMLDGVVVTPKDAAGNVVEPFIVDGTTYLPIRAVANALGLGVGWNQQTSTVLLTSDGSTPTVPTQPESTPTPAPAQPAAPAETVQGVSYRITYQNCRLSDGISGMASYDAIVEIENNGTENLYLKDATFDFEDKTGHLLETESFVSSDPEIIAPGEKGYFFSSGMLEKVGLNTDYVFKPVLKVEKAKNSIIRYNILDTAKENTAYDGVTITGRVQNNTAKDDGMIWVAVVLFRADGTPIAAGGTNVLDVKAGDTASFSRKFTSYDLGVSPAEVASYKVFAGKVQYQF